MKYSRYIALTIILLLALFPVALYAETSHDGHGGGTAPSSQKQDISTPAAGQNVNNPSGSSHNMTDIQGSGQSITTTPPNQSMGQTGTPPAAEKAASGGSHDSHGSGPAAATSAAGQDHGSAAVSEKSSAGEHESGGHGGESKPNVLQPVKNGIVAGFAIFNGLIIIAAIIMKKKLGQGV